MKLTALWMLFVLIAPLAAQEAKPSAAPSKEESVSKIFELKYRDPGTLSQLLFQFGAKVQSSQGLKALAVSGPSAVVDAVGEAIKRLDVPVKNAELTAYLLAASQQAGQAEAVPKELESVVKQLRGLFAYQNFRLLDIMIARTREGQSLDMTSTGPGQNLPSAPVAKPAVYTLRVQSVNVTPEAKGDIIRLDRLRFGARVPTGDQAYDTGINTDLDVREGQKVVVGKTGVGNSGDALILVVTARVVD